MNKTFTFEDLIRFAYNETNLIETVQIRHAIDENENLCEMFVSLVSVLNILDNLLIEPADKCSKAVLDYSKALVLS
jgi:hypothetical protein